MSDRDKIAEDLAELNRRGSEWILENASAILDASDCAAVMELCRQSFEAGATWAEGQHGQAG